MRNDKKRLGIYAGSFNPFHVGHADVLHQALEVFDEVIVARGVNPSKVDIAEVDEFPTGHPVFRNASVVSFVGLLSDYLEMVEYENPDAKVFLIRGLRNGADLQYEQNQSRFIRGMYAELRTTFFICDKEFEHISSSALRELKKLSPKEYQKYVFAKPETPRYEGAGDGFVFGLDDEADGRLPGWRLHRWKDTAGHFPGDL